MLGFILNLVSNLLLNFTSGLSFCAVMNKNPLSEQYAFLLLPFV